jgi:two-component system sensor histidine kinase FlrB
MASSSAGLSLSSAAPHTELISLEERSLVRAFALFTDAAASLERSYAQLQSEVTRLRRELEDSNRDLSRSLEKNRRMQRHLDRIVEGLPCGVLVAETTGQISVANPAARKLLGFADEVPLAVFDQLPDWAAGLLNLSSSSGHEMECACAEGDTEWLAVRRAQLPESDGGSTIFILRDTTESKRLEQAQDVLRRRQALAEMSALLAHEIRNPLGSLELFAGLLAGSGLDGEREQWVAHLRAGLRMLSATVNNVLHFYSPALLELVSTDIGQLLRAIEEFLRPLAQQASVEVTLVHRLDGVLVAADPHRLEQVVLNVALNALRFMPGGGKVRISGEVREKLDRHVASIEICDSGPGVAPEHLERIFEPGFTTRQGSPGLGLAVCKTIMEQHGGGISVASGPGQGTTFTLELPLMGVA